MAETYDFTGADGATWEDAGNWAALGAGADWPGQNVTDDSVIIDDHGHKPAPPVAPVSLKNFTAVLDASSTSAAWNTVVVGNGNDGVATFTGGILNITAYGNVVITDATPVRAMVAGVGNFTLIFTDSRGLIFGMTGTPVAVYAAHDLAIVSVDSQLDFNNVNIRVGYTPDDGHINAGSLCLVAGPFDLILTSGTFHGSSLPGCTYATFGVTGSPPSVDGFEPLYKLGAAGGTLDSYGSGAIIALPLASDVKSGVVYGPSDNQQLGELSGGSGGRGGMGLGL